MSKEVKAALIGAIALILAALIGAGIFFRPGDGVNAGGSTPTLTPSPTPSPRVVVRSSDGPQNTSTAGSATASCQGNEVMVGGGYTTTDPQATLLISANYPSSLNSWSASYSLYYFNLSPRPSPTPTPLRVLARAYAVCVSFSRPIETVIVPGESVSLQGPTALPDAQCPSGYTLLSGGYTTPFDPGNTWIQQGWASASYPSSSLTWHVAVGKFGKYVAGDYQTYALCGKGTGIEQSTIVSNSFSIPGYQMNHESASCSSDQLASGGGYQLKGLSTFGSDGPQSDTQWVIDLSAQSGTVYAVCIQFANA